MCVCTDHYVWGTLLTLEKFLGTFDEVQAIFGGIEFKRGSYILAK